MAILSLRRALRHRGTSLGGVGYRAGATPAHGNTTGFTVTIPAGTQAGDLMILAVGWALNAAAAAPDPAGWTLATPEVDDEGNLGTRLYTRVAAGTTGTSSDAGTTVTLTFAATLKAVVFCEVWFGTKLRTIQSLAEGATAVTSHTTPTLVSDVDGAWAVTFLWDKATTGTTTWTADASQTVRHSDTANTGTSPVTGLVTDYNIPVLNGGTVGGLVYTSNGSATSRCVMYTVLIEPAAGAPPNPNQGKAVMGMYNACNTVTPDGQAAGAGFAGGGDIASAWKNIRDANMDTSLVKVRRAFSPTLPSTDNTGDAALGIVSCLSVKTSIPTAATGGTDAAFTTLAAAMPAGSYMILWHEPEDDVASGAFTAAQWVTAQTHFYDACKAGNANVIVGPSHMAYQWGSTMPSTTNTDQWIIPAGKCDFLGVDAYLMEFQTGYSNIFAEPRFARWHAWASSTGNPGGVPLAFTELGVVRKYESNPGSGWTYTYPYSDAQLEAVIRNSVPQAVAAGYRLILWWHSWHADFSGSGTSADPWHFRDFNLTATVSETTNTPGPLALQAWRDMVTQYGSTNTDLRTLG